MSSATDPNRDAPQPQAVICSWLPVGSRALIDDPDAIAQWRSKKIRPTGADGWMETLGRDNFAVLDAGVDLAGASMIYLEMAAKNEAGSCFTELFFARHPGQFNEDAKLRTTITADGQFRRYLLPLPERLGDLPLKEVACLRFDPLQSEGQFCVKALQLLPPQLAPQHDRERALTIALAGPDGPEAWTPTSAEGPAFVQYSAIPDDFRLAEIECTLAARASGRAHLQLVVGKDPGSLLWESPLSVQVDTRGRPKVYKIPIPATIESLSRHDIRCFHLRPLDGDGEFCLQQIRCLPEALKHLDRRPSLLRALARRLGRLWNSSAGRRDRRLAGPGAGTAQAERPVFFIHIPKCAGNTIKKFLLAGLPPHLILDTHKRTFLADCGPLDDYAVVSGHLGYGDADAFSTPPRIVTVLRDPTDRVLSVHRFARRYTQPRNEERQKRGLPDNARHLDLAGFLAWGQDVPPGRSVMNNQTWFLSRKGSIEGRGNRRDRSLLAEAKANLQSCEVVGICEDMPNTVLLLCYRLGLPLLNTPIPRANTSAQRNPGSGLTPQEQTLMDEINSMDNELYVFAKELFNTQLAEMISDLGQERHQRYLKEVTA